MSSQSPPDELGILAAFAQNAFTGPSPISVLMPYFVVESVLFGALFAVLDIQNISHATGVHTLLTGTMIYDLT